MELWPCGCISCWISTYIDHSGCLCLRLTYSYFFLHIAQPQGSVWTWLLAEFWPLFTFFFCPGPANSCVCTGLYACPDTHCSCRANIVPHAEYITGSQLLTKEVSFTLLRAWSATSQRAPRCVCVCSHCLRRWPHSQQHTHWHFFFFPFLLTVSLSDICRGVSDTQNF